ncbi:hypothetical protein AeMF1_011220 [Aphanomyces euteiches]|nr:hypothetical protein AeMF1_011220 [Aphanomyces euteiches]KAH9190668.1 hypothetical protein AeNC1_007346 [Aphanomyces euteiches]
MFSCLNCLIVCNEKNRIGRWGVVPASRPSKSKSACVCTRERLLSRLVPTSTNRDVYREHTEAIYAGREREPSVNTKRQLAAEAAERREQSFHQGGGGDKSKTKSLAARREKDELVGKIMELYVSLGEDPPIGLNTCSVDQLKEHMAKLKKKKEGRRKS